MTEAGSLLCAGYSDFPGVTLAGQTSKSRADAESHAQGFPPHSHLVTLGMLYKKQLKLEAKKKH